MSTDAKSTALTPQLIERGKIAEWTSNGEVRQQITAALGGVLDTDMFIAHCRMAFADPLLADCTPQSKYRALHQIAALGLLPTLDQVALVPYREKDEQGNVIETVCTAMPQWQGYDALMRRNRDVLDMQASLVHISDEFRFHNGQVEHDYDPFDATRQINGVEDIRGGYLKILYKDGRTPKYHLVTAAHIAKSMACSRRPKLWKNWFASMALKTLYRDAYARRAVPMDPAVNARLQTMVRADDEALANDPDRVGQQAIAAPDGAAGGAVTPPASAPSSRTQALAESLKQQLNVTTADKATAEPIETASEPTTKEEASKEPTAEKPAAEPPKEQAEKPKRATKPKAAAKPPAERWPMKDGKIDWGKSTVEQRTEFTLEQVDIIMSKSRDAADATPALERLAAISKGIKESSVGKDGYVTIMAAITNAEKTLQKNGEADASPPFDAAEPTMENEQLMLLRQLLKDVNTAEALTQISHSWDEERETVGEEVYATGLKIIEESTKT